ncbi:hypothetical protein FQN57_006551 [Myotisia sp. PD_48]|nr:hypothetical protein FQN57_006551 [Myotisia sp. PD_48]
MRLFIAAFIQSKSRIRRPGTWASNKELFKYTSGRFLFNEDLRRSERQVHVNVDALASAICLSVGKPEPELTSIVKLAEGGINRVLQATFNNGYEVIARIPYHIMLPKHRATASEAATLDLLRSYGIPAPKVLGYSTSDTNPVGAEYLLEKIDGNSLGDEWFTMNNKNRVKIMRQIVNLENQFMNIPFPASGSLYYQKDLGSEFSIPLATQYTSDAIVVGPTAQFAWYYQERASLDIKRGPWKAFLDCFEAPAFKEKSPTTHIQVLSQYLKLWPSLNVPSEHPFSRPVLRHPDFSPNNILINSSYDIVGLIDWQHSAVLPLCLCAGIPDHFQNWGDPLSERLAKPEVKLPDGFNMLSQTEQDTMLETMRQMPDHFDALRNENAMLRAKLFDRASAPWEGDSLSLKHTIFQAYQKWPMHLEINDSATEPLQCPILFTEEEAGECIREYTEEQEKLEELQEMRDAIGINSVGWVPDDEHLEKSKEVVQAIKAGLLEHSTTNIERVSVRDHFPFDSHSEDI